MKYICFLLLLFCTPCISQVEVATIVHQVDTNNPSLKNMPISGGFVLVSETEEEFGVFLNFGAKIIAKGLDASYTILGTLESRNIKSREEYIAGKAFGNVYYLFFKDKFNGAIRGISFNFKTKKVTDFDLSLTLKDYNIFQCVEQDDMLYFLSVMDFSPTKVDDELLFIHSLDRNFNSNKLVVDMSSLALFDESNKQRAFQRIINTNKSAITGINLHPTQKDFPVTLPESTKSIKIYKKETVLTLGFDINPLQTQLLELDIITGEIAIKNIEKGSKEQKIKQSNSFLLGSELFQIVRNKTNLTVFIKDISTGKEINSFNISKGEEEFLNTNTATLKLKPSKRIREKVSPKQFLKYSANQPLGVYATKTQDATQITYGVWNKKKGNNRALDNSKQNGSGSVPIAIGGAALGGGVFGAMMFMAINNASSNAIQAYGMHHLGTTTRAIGVFDTDFNHLADQGVKANIFHRIDYYNIKKTNTTPLLLFRFNNTILYGSFYPNQNAIELLRFN